MSKGHQNGGFYTIQYNRKRCIGCGLCASLAPQRWMMNEKNGKAVLLNARANGHLFVSIAPELEYPEEARQCPARAIQVPG